MPAIDNPTATFVEAPDQTGCVAKGEKNYIKWFGDISIDDVPLVGGKNASLGEMYGELTPQGIRVPNGFAITANAYRNFLHAAGLEPVLQELLTDLDTSNVYFAGAARNGAVAKES